MTRSMLSRVLRLGAMAVAFAAVAPLPAQAQIGGLVKKKLKDAVKAQAGQTEQPAASQGAPQGPTFGDYVVEMTPANLDRLETALRAEKAYRDSIATFYARLPTADAYGQCNTQVMMSPEAQKISESMPENADLATVQKMGQQLQDLVVKKCGPDPSTFHKSDDLRRAPETGAKAAGFTKDQYAIMQERIVPFCKAGDAPSRIPGSGTNIYYVYAPGEVQALGPRCSKLVPLIAS